MRRLEGKTALITGCNRGIGKAILERFAYEGARIIASTRSITPELQSHYDLISKRNDVSIIPITMDLSDEESVKTALKSLQADKTPVDILINNAGVAAGGFLLTSKIDTIKEVFQINYFSQILITQYVVKKMMRQKSGSIVFMSSVLGLDAMPGATAYGASKAAVALLVKSLSKEVGGFGIRVNAIAPNLIDTVMAEQMEKKSYDRMVSATALKRTGRPDEIAALAAFLASDDSSYITGQIIRADGGI